MVGPAPPPRTATLLAESASTSLIEKMIKGGRPSREVLPGANQMLKSGPTTFPVRALEASPIS